MKNNFIRKSIFKLRDILLPRESTKDSWDFISRAILEGKPLMLCRFGAVEIKAICYAKLLPSPFHLLAKKYTFINMPRNAGFFPATDESFNRFAELMLQDAKYIDILASWRIEEILMKSVLQKAYKTDLAALNLEYTDKFWLRSLKGKKVLVIHPFSETIKHQYYKNRTKLFPDPNFLPEFATFNTVKAVQTIAGNNAGFETWFDALEYMKREIEKFDFDVCLIGCGAYGFPLAAHVKRIGKQGIHVGGVLQLYFGIKGKRWDNLGLYNQYWVSPSDDEKPKGLQNVEGGCYW